MRQQENIPVLPEKNNAPYIILYAFAGFIGFIVGLVLFGGFWALASSTAIQFGTALYIQNKNP